MFQGLLQISTFFQNVFLKYISFSKLGIASLILNKLGKFIFSAMPKRHYLVINIIILI